MELLAQAIGEFNGFIAAGLETFVASNADVTVNIVDTTLPFDEAIQNPAEYGSPDALCFNADGVSCVSTLYNMPVLAVANFRIALARQLSPRDRDSAARVCLGGRSNRF